MPGLGIKETLFSDYFAYFKNYVPKINVVLRFLFDFSLEIRIN